MKHRIAILVIVSIASFRPAVAHDKPCLNTNSIALDSLSVQECMLKTSDGWIPDTCKVDATVSSVKGADLFVPVYPTYRWDGSQWIKTMEGATK